jgi:LmbE family N-acetylglucosaminyl deacetylase
MSFQEAMMNNRNVACAIAVALAMLVSLTRSNHATSKTLVALWAHDDDIVAAAPVLARYAREGMQVYTIIATDGAQGSLHTAIPSGPELAQVRAAEGRCAARALGIHPPVLLGFPDAKLGDYTDDRTRLYQLTDRVQSELERLRPDALITWGPDGGTGHPDHRLVSSVLTQLVRAGAPGTTERLFYASLPAEGMRAVNPGRGLPRFMIPLQKYFTVRVPFTSVDLEASLRAFSCHKTQFPPDVMLRVSETLKAASMRELPMTPLFPAKMTNDLFDR